MARKQKTKDPGYAPDAGTFDAVQVTLGQVVKAVEQLGQDVNKLTIEVKSLAKRLRSMDSST